MAKDGKKKVKSRASTKYATSSDEENSSDDEDNLLALFANLNMQQKEKLNELIGAIHEKDELLDSQEDFLIKENKKHVVGGLRLTTFENKSPTSISSSPSSFPSCRRPCHYHLIMDI
jgi:hypothetical protein